MEVTFTTFYHRQKHCIGLHFKPQAKLQKQLQQNLLARWSATNKCWYCEENENNIAYLQNELGILVGKTGSRKAEKIEPAKIISAKIPILQITLKKELVKKKKPDLSKENLENLQQLIQILNLKSYSTSTQRTYINEFTQFLNLLGKSNAADFSVARIKDYLEYCKVSLQLSENSLHSRMNALKFFYEQVLKREKFFWEIPRPKKQTILPKVISKERIADLINAIENLKHKTIIMLTYACGLRVSEVVSLKVKAIDGQRKTLFIEKAKGKKDRIVSLNPNMLIMLREYYRQYQPKVYLFEGQYKNEHLSERSIQQVMQKAKRKAGIIQEGSMHMLRHSFATHLLDKGIDVVFIQKLLGHNNIKTTLQYLHVTNKDLSNIISPLADIEALLKK